MKQEEAMQIGLDGLVMLASDEEICLPFLAQTGASIADIEARKNDPEFLGFVLEFLMTHDEWVLALAGISQIRPEEVIMAQNTLSGGTPHWT